MQIIVLAAGKGSRLPKKYRRVPKCLVKVNSKSIIDHNISFIRKFSNRIIISGYKYKILENHLKDQNFKHIKNQNYSSTNMVHSLSLAKKFVKDDVVIIYGDIIFNPNIYKLLSEKKNLLPVNKTWFKNWKERMGEKKIFEDAEYLKILNNKIIEIGTKINKNKIPKYQYMGIMKFKKNSFHDIISFYKTIHNKKIDMTTFLNLCINKKIINLKAKIYKSYWYEIDTISDHLYAEKKIK